MSMDGSDKTLIDSLIADGAPVRRLWPMPARWAVWLILCVVFAAAVGTAFGWSFPTHADPMRFRTEMFVALVAVLVWSALALRAAVPGRTPRAGRIVVACAVALSPMLFWHAAPGPASFVANGIPCAERTVVLALLPALAMLWAVWRGAPLAPRRAAALSGGAGFLIAYVLMRVLCSVDEPAHLLVWHVLPIAGGVALAAAGGGWWLSRWRR